MTEIIRQGVKTKVLLLSATPVNTGLSDLRNQLYFLTEGRDVIDPKAMFHSPSMLRTLYVVMVSRIICGILSQDGDLRLKSKAPRT